MFSARRSLRALFQEVGSKKSRRCLKLPNLPPSSQISKSKIRIMKLLSSFFLTFLPLVAAEVQCPLPEVAKTFSAIVYGDMDNAAHNVYGGVAVGGVFKNTIAPYNSVAVNGRSYVGSIQQPITINWNGGVVQGSTLEDAGIDWSYFEYMARNTYSTTINGWYKIERRTSGGTFNTYDFQPGGQGEDNGRTIVFFDTTDQVTLTKTSDSRQFGPTIIAPFSHVEVVGDAGYVDGLIVARSLSTTGGNAGQLQLHGDYYKGYLPCINPPPVPTAEPTSLPTSAPTVISVPPAPTPTGSNGDPHCKFDRSLTVHKLPRLITNKAYPVVYSSQDLEE